MEGIDPDGTCKLGAEIRSLIDPESGGCCDSTVPIPSWNDWPDIFLKIYQRRGLEQNLFQYHRYLLDIAYREFERIWAQVGNSKKQSIISENHLIWMDFLGNRVITSHKLERPAPNYVTIGNWTNLSTTLQQILQNQSYRKNPFDILFGICKRLTVFVVVRRVFVGVLSGKTVGLFSDLWSILENLPSKSNCQMKL